MARLPSEERRSAKALQWPTREGMASSAGLTGKMLKCPTGVVTSFPVSADFDAPITLRDVRYQYAGTRSWALDGLTLDVPAGTST